MERWAASELRYVNLGDARRNKRLIKLVEDLAAQPTRSSAVRGTIEVLVKRNPERPARTAKLTIRYETIEIEVWAGLPFIWGHTSNCWNSFAIYILAVFDPYFFQLCEKSGLMGMCRHIGMMTVKIHGKR